jgi:hypothetical protein
MIYRKYRCTEHYQHPSQHHPCLHTCTQRRCHVTRQRQGCHVTRQTTTSGSRTGLQTHSRLGTFYLDFFPLKTVCITGTTTNGTTIIHTSTWMMGLHTRDTIQNGERRRTSNGHHREKGRTRDASVSWVLEIFLSLSFFRRWYLLIYFILFYYWFYNIEAPCSKLHDEPPPSMNGTSLSSKSFLVFSCFYYINDYADFVYYR